jgi:thiamine transporter ThiT
MNMALTALVGLATLAGGSAVFVAIGYLTGLIFWGKPTVKTVHADPYTLGLIGFTVVAGLLTLGLVLCVVGTIVLELLP